MTFMRGLSWPIVVGLVVVLGLAPFQPEPHIWEKLKLLMAGQLRAPIDIFDFVFHGAPWGLLIVKGIDALRHKPD
ncbi:MAG: RND transporter [Halocynthiibacter sp.]